MEFLLLGPLEVRESGRVLRIEGVKQRALLALLLLHANEIVSRDRLLHELWIGDPLAPGSTALRVRVSQLRKALRDQSRIATRPPGYVLRVEPGELDLHRFERLVEEATDAEPRIASAKLREALALWRGEPLSELVDEPFAQAAAARLEELRLAALETRVEADLALGRHTDLVAELQGLVREHPLRERILGQLMLALYRSRRQADALEAYRVARSTLADTLGLEPSPALQQLERAILQHDPVLELQTLVPPPRSIVLASARDADLETLLPLAEALAKRPTRQLILVRVVGSDELAEVSELLSRRRDELRGRGITARVAVFTSTDPGRDVVRIAREQDVDLMLLSGSLSAAATVVLDRAPCDVGVLLGGEPISLGSRRPVLVPFGGAEHDWAALELGTWIAHAQDAPLLLVGAAAHGDEGDASRLIASASLIVQHVAGIETATMLVQPGEEGLLEAAGSAGLVVFGVSVDWRERGPGKMREALARRAGAPTLLVRKGLRPGGLAPEESRTRFTWSFAE